MFSKFSPAFNCFLFLPLLIHYSNPVHCQDLPQRSLRSKFRVQVFESSDLSLDSMKLRIADIRNEFGINVYLISNKGYFKILTGDFTARENAKSKLNRIRKTFKNARIVKADNKSVIYFQLFEKKKEIKPLKNDLEVADHKMSIKTSQKMRLTEPLSFDNSFEAWNDPRYLEANTAADEDYLSEPEKEVFYYLNLVRMNPNLFANTYLLKHAGELDNEYEVSLYEELNAIEPMPCLKPNKQCWESAKCHAIVSGQSGFVGHEREGCTSYFWGECCQYGPSDPLAIILQLLIDRGVESLGHRRICLGSYDELGVAIQPHITYVSNAVLDFR